MQRLARRAVIAQACTQLLGRALRAGGVGFPLEQMFSTARIVKGRRGQDFPAVEEQLYLDLYEQTRLERERAFQKAQDRREDRWPVSNVGR